MIKLSNLLKVNIKIERKKKYPNYIVKTNKLENNYLLVEYLNQYPLFSSKYLNYKD
jgi:hypothetical protein